MERASLDFARLRTPARDGDVLIEPTPDQWAPAARANHQSLRDAGTIILDHPLSYWRKRCRDAIAGGDDRLVIVSGHQPAFIHPGVWAKHIAATRMASAVDGVAFNVVVDSDAPRETALTIPTVQDQSLKLVRVPFARLSPGCAFEQIPCMCGKDAAEFEKALRAAMGERFETSQMPVFLKALKSVSPCRDWVDQAVAARRAIECTLGIEIDDIRLSDNWCTPLTVDMLVNAPRFAASYNKALAWYRREHNVRGHGRPIPDLACTGDRCEVPLWIFSADSPRTRLFVERTGETVKLFAGEELVGVPSPGDLTSCNTFSAWVERVGTWRIRPRALTLTIWARLLLADLFVHGIGGAKYDRISDVIMADYYHVCPPGMVCVSATVWLGLNDHGVTPRDVREQARGIRDLLHNPQRHLDRTEDNAALLDEREAAVGHARSLAGKVPQDHAARSAAFTQVRALNARLVESGGTTLAERETQLTRMIEMLNQDIIAQGREYFMGLYDSEKLARLVEMVPQTDSFRL